MTPTLSSSRMNRRNVLQLMGAAGLASASPLLRPRAYTRSRWQPDLPDLRSLFRPPARRCLYGADRRQDRPRELRRA